MNADKAARRFVGTLAALKMEDCFNPYTDRCDTFDLADAPSIRSANLIAVLANAIEIGISDIWIALELGHKGGRRTGLAMTDDARLPAHAKRFAVENKVRVATHSGPTREITSGIVWETLDAIDRPIFLWNVVPVHAHLSGNPLSNRRHTRTEGDCSLPLLLALLAMLEPRRLVAVGGDASAALSRQGLTHEKARHPAFGGKQDFVTAMMSMG